MTKKVPYALIILDGWCEREATDSNAIKLAKTPVLDQLQKTRPHCLISCSGEDVGLPAGQMGNSEVGHMTLGAGRVIDQDLTRINKAITQGDFFKNPVLMESMDQLVATGNTLHIMGLLSPGGVHSHEDQIQAAVKMAFERGLKAVYVHAFLDGRDVPPKSAEASLANMQACIDNLGQGGIASIVGRYYAMDRDNRWERVEPAYQLLTQGHSDYQFDSAVAALHAAYARNESDEFVKPSAILQGGQVVKMAAGDGVLFMNFRADRARELSRAFIDPGFTGFKRQAQPALQSFVTLTQYADNILTPCAFGPSVVTNSLGEYVAKLGKSQLRLAETEKYAHVTFFFSGGREAEYAGETRRLVPSPRVATYDLQPEMSAQQVTDECITGITGGDYDLIICNFANGDMVGHTGNLNAAIQAVEFVDSCIGRIVDALSSVGGHCLITADHGNVEQMTDPSTGQAHTAHTSERVPLIYVGSETIQLAQSTGKLTDVAPTLLAIMHLPAPPEMTGHSLVLSEQAQTAKR
jgi:2,3-bisphosphoglycerate-independent phosphoglycerate mutase